MLKVNRSKVYQLWFSWYSKQTFQKHFDAVRTFGTNSINTSDLTIPIIFYINHSYWWDGFWSLLCTEKYFKQNLFIIIEYKQLVRYQFFRKLGAFSIVRDNPRDAMETINYAAEILTKHAFLQNALWIFPQGLIEHVDTRPLQFFSGTGKIVEKILEKSGKVYISSVVSRIDYLGEQKPELFLSFKAPELIIKENFSSAKQITQKMQLETELHLDELKARIMSKEFSGSDILVKGKESVNRRFDFIKKVFGLKS